RAARINSLLLHQDVPSRLLECRECPSARAAREWAERLDRVNRARQEALRREWLRKVSRHARSRRRAFGFNAEGRLRPCDTRGRPRTELDLPGRVVSRGHLPDDEYGRCE